MAKNVKWSLQALNDRKHILSYWIRKNKLFGILIRIPKIWDGNSKHINDPNNIPLFYNQQACEHGFAVCQLRRCGLAG